MLLSVSDGLKKTLRVVSPHFSNETIYLPYDNNLENPIWIISQYHPLCVPPMSYLQNDDYIEKQI